MTGKKAASWSHRRQELVDALFVRAQFCAICGGKLKHMGSLDSKFKTCDKGCGTVFAQGNRRDLRLGLVMEVQDEG
jgi:hypothetical protein